jgi:hypothetical protein
MSPRPESDTFPNGTVAYVTELPMCDVCKHNGDATVPAQYDARLSTGQWGFVCVTHFTLYQGKVGLGLGQRLVIREEKPVRKDDVRLTTPPCVHCERTSEVTLTATEFMALCTPDLLIQEALPERDDDFRELVKSGIHKECWTEMFNGKFGDGS